MKLKILFNTKFDLEKPTILSGDENCSLLGTPIQLIEA